MIFQKYKDYIDIAYDFFPKTLDNIEKYMYNV